MEKDKGKTWTRHFFTPFSASSNHDIRSNNDNENALRYWNDQVYPDAIYSVYLKKIRYSAISLLPTQGNSNTFNNTTNDPVKNETKFRGSVDNTSAASTKLQWENTKIRYIKAGTLDKLIDELTDECGTINQTYVSIFLDTFRSFVTSSHLFDMLAKRYLAERVDSPSSHMRKKSFEMIFVTWLEAHPEDFVGSCSELFTYSFGEFVKLHFEPELKAKAIRLLEIANNSFTPFERLPLFAKIDKYYKPTVSTMLYNSYFDFESFDEYLIAEQLTFMDANLFRKLIPYECMGIFWSNKDKPPASVNLKSGLENAFENIDCLTVMATVDFFNLVTYKVMDSILSSGCYLRDDAPKSESSMTKTLKKWIDIARELRLMKNFSSMKAVVSALRSNSIYRLENIWSLLSKETKTTFEDLSILCSDDNNQASQRQLLEREGTAKLVETGSSCINGPMANQQSYISNHYNGVSANGPLRLKQRKKLLTAKSRNRYQRSQTDLGCIQGTVPYLGTFLTDLTMLHTLHPDIVRPNNATSQSNNEGDFEEKILRKNAEVTTTNGLINFDKRRKEFDTLLQLKLYQASASNYNIEPDWRFWSWFGGNCEHFKYFQSFYARFVSCNSNEGKTYDKSDENWPALVQKQKYELICERTKALRIYERGANEKSAKSFSGPGGITSHMKKSFTTGDINNVNQQSPNTSKNLNISHENGASYDKNRCNYRQEDTVKRSQQTPNRNQQYNGEHAIKYGHTNSFEGEFANVHTQFSKSSTISPASNTYAQSPNSSTLTPIKFNHMFPFMNRNDSLHKRLKNCVALDDTYNMSGRVRTKFDRDFFAPINPLARNGRVLANSTTYESSPKANALWVKSLHADNAYVLNGLDDQNLNRGQSNFLNHDNNHLTCVDTPTSYNHISNPTNGYVGYHQKPKIPHSTIASYAHEKICLETIFDSILPPTSPLSSILADESLASSNNIPSCTLNDNGLCGYNKALLVDDSGVDSLNTFITNDSSELDFNANTPININGNKNKDEACQDDPIYNDIAEVGLNNNNNNEITCGDKNVKNGENGYKSTSTISSDRFSSDDSTLKMFDPDCCRAIKVYFLDGTLSTTNHKTKSLVPSAYDTYYNIYKSIWITNSDKTSDVIRRALKKYGINTESEININCINNNENKTEHYYAFNVLAYSLYQIELDLVHTLIVNNSAAYNSNSSSNNFKMPLKGCFHLPADANVFYAMKSDLPIFIIVKNAALNQQINSNNNNISKMTISGLQSFWWNKGKNCTHKKENTPLARKLKG